MFPINVTINHFLYHMGPKTNHLIFPLHPAI